MEAFAYVFVANFAFLGMLSWALRARLDTLRERGIAPKGTPKMLEPNRSFWVLGFTWSSDHRQIGDAWLGGLVLANRVGQVAICLSLAATGLIDLIYG